MYVRQEDVDDIPLDRTLHYRRKFELFNDGLQGLPEKQRRAIVPRKLSIEDIEMWGGGCG